MNPGKHLKVNTTLKILYQNMNSQNKAHIKITQTLAREIYFHRLNTNID